MASDMGNWNEQSVGNWWYFGGIFWSNSLENFQEFFKEFSFRFVSIENWISAIFRDFRIKSPFVHFGSFQTILIKHFAKNTEKPSGHGWNTQTLYEHCIQFVCEHRTDMVPTHSAPANSFDWKPSESIRNALNTTFHPKMRRVSLSPLQIVCLFYKLQRLFNHFSLFNQFFSTNYIFCLFYRKTS